MVAKESQSVLERGDAAPDFELRGTDGETHTLAEFDSYEGVLVVFTCNHCPYAKAKFDEMNRLASEYDEVAVVGINPNDEEEYPADDFETMVERVEDETIQWDAYLRDESQQIATAYGAMCTPDPFLFERSEDGFELAYHGRLDDAPNPDEKAETREMKAHIETMLAGDAIETEQHPSRGCSIKWTSGNEPDYWNDD